MRDELLFNVPTTKYLYSSGGSLIGTYNTTHISERKYRSDITYGTRRSDGFRLPTYYQACYARVISHDFSLEVKPTLTSSIRRTFVGRSSTGDVSGNHTAYPSCTGSFQVPVPSSALRAEADNKALAGLKAGDFNALVALGELPLTVISIADNVVALLKVLNAIARGNFQHALNLLFGDSTKRGFRARRRGNKTIFEDAYETYHGVKPSRRNHRHALRSPQDFWLTYQYMVRPLMLDTFNLADALMRDWENHPPLLSSTGVAVNNLGAPSHIYATGLRGQSSGSIVQGAETKLFYSVDNPFVYGLNSLGFINPFEVIWELMPLSFVFDWFIPFGAFLEALTGWFGTTFFTGYQLDFVKGDWRMEYTPLGYYPVSGTLPVLDGTICCMRRIPLITYPLPKIYIDLGLSSPQVISALSLLMQSRRA